jgi:MFS transporter, DHA2 family, methylenomycin A resistance protein
MTGNARRSADRSIVRTVVAASFGFALIQLDVTIVNVALPNIGRVLGIGVAGLQWVVDAYTVSFASFLLSAGFLGDRFGARRVYLAGMAMFTGASLICGLAPSGGWLIAARALQGLGAAAMLPCSLALLNHAAAHDETLRARAVGWWTAAGAITIASGPIVGGILLSVAGWRSIFFVNLPVCAFGAWLTLGVRETESDSAGSFDPLGQALAVIAVAGLVAAVIEARPVGLDSPYVILAAVVGVAAAAGFVWTEKIVQTPMLPLALFQAPGLSPALLLGIVVNLTYYGVIFVVSLYLQDVLGYSPIAAGLAFLPLTATFFASNVFSGWLVGKVGPRMPMIVGALIDAAGFGLLLTLGAGSGYGAMLLPFILLPAGMGLAVPAITNTVLSSVEKQKSGLASGALNAARQAAGAVGVALFGSFATGGRSQIVSGLHLSAAASGFLLIVASAGIYALVQGRVPRRDLKRADGNFSGDPPRRDQAS